MEGKERMLFIIYDWHWSIKFRGGALTHSYSDWFAGSVGSELTGRERDGGRKIDVSCCGH